MIKPKKYRFFYHYYRQYDCMSIHYKGACTRVDSVVCEAKNETKRNKTQPRLVIQGFSSNVKIVKRGKETVAIIEK